MANNVRGPSTEPSATISVIVPTRNRPESVVRAVRSALNQSFPPLEVLVVVDGPDPDTVHALTKICDPRLIVVELTENGGPSRARNVGTQHSTGDWVAYLDDDDEWFPEKLRTQVAFADCASESSRLVLATRVEWKGDSTTDHWPLRSILPHERVTDYLFVRQRPGEGVLHTSTIMLQRELALSCPFPEHLRIHEDYDWFIALEEAGAEFAVILQPLATYNAPSTRSSLSSNAKWQVSLAWALSRKGDMSERAFSDFCLTTVARLAKLAGFRAQMAVLSAAFTGRPSLFSTVRFVAICLLSEDARRRLAVKGSRQSSDNAA